MNKINKLRLELYQAQSKYNSFKKSSRCYKKIALEYKIKELMTELLTIQARKK